MTVGESEVKSEAAVATPVSFIAPLKAAKTQHMEVGADPSCAGSDDDEDGEEQAELRAAMSSDHMMRPSTSRPIRPKHPGDNEYSNHALTSTLDRPEDTMSELDQLKLAFMSGLVDDIDVT